MIQSNFDMKTFIIMTMIVDFDPSLPNGSYSVTVKS